MSRAARCHVGGGLAHPQCKVRIGAIYQALSFRPDLVDAITGWGLHFVEGLNRALAVTVVFAVSLLLGVVFAVCWTVWRQDIQGAFGVASYVTSAVTLAVMTWQMWAV